MAKRRSAPPRVRPRAERAPPASDIDPGDVGPTHSSFAADELDSGSDAVAIGMFVTIVLIVALFTLAFIVSA